MRISENIRKLRLRLNETPEASGKEASTSELVRTYLEKNTRAKLICSVATHGLMAVFEGKMPGKTILLRADMDAVSCTVDGKNVYRHLCGHDGHMAALCGCAELLSFYPIEKGKVILLFQPAEETGEGALSVIKEGFPSGEVPDMAFAMHNLPAYPLCTVVCREGVFASASGGLVLLLHGTQSHASAPVKAGSPTIMMKELLHLVENFAAELSSEKNGEMITLTHFRIGQPGFGVSPGEALMHLVIRARTDKRCQEINHALAGSVKHLASSCGVDVSFSVAEVFPALVNHPSAVRILRNVAESSGLNYAVTESPFGWSEDFSHFSQRIPSCMFGLGMGNMEEGLHENNYSFNDEILETAASLFFSLAKAGL